MSVGLPGTYGRADTLSAKAAIAGLLALAVGALSGPALAYAGLLLLLGTVPMALRAGPLPRDGWRVGLALTAAFALWTALSTVLGMPLEAPWQGRHADALFDLLQLLLFPLVGLATRGRARHVALTLAGVITGFYLGRITDADSADWRILIQGARPSIDMTPLALSEYAAASLCILLAVAPWLWNRYPNWWQRIPGAGAWGLLVLASAYLTVIGRTRGVWLALAVVALMAMILLLIRENRRGSIRYRRWLPPLAVAGVLATAMVVSWPTISARFASESESLARLASGELASVDERSIGARVQMWLFAVDLVSERPISGWGPGATEPLMRVSDNNSVNPYNDLHSIIFELPVRVGLPGAAFFLALSSWLLYTAGRCAVRRGSEAWPALAVFLVLSLHLLAGFTNFRMLNVDWRFLWLIAAGLAAGYAIPVEESSTS